MEKDIDFIKYKLYHPYNEIIPFTTTNKLLELKTSDLFANGMPTEYINILGECSFQNSSRYYSARKQGIETGRMVSGIMLLK